MKILEPRLELVRKHWPSLFLFVAIFLSCFPAQIVETITILVALLP